MIVVLLSAVDLELINIVDLPANPFKKSRYVCVAVPPRPDAMCLDETKAIDVTPMRIVRVLRVLHPLGYLYITEDVEAARLLPPALLPVQNEALRSGLVSP